MDAGEVRLLEIALLLFPAYLWQWSECEAPVEGLSFLSQGVEGWESTQGRYQAQTRHLSYTTKVQGVISVNEQGRIWSK